MMLSTKLGSIPRENKWLLGALFVVLLFLLMTYSRGFYTTDESGYFLGTDALAKHHSLETRNGLEETKSLMFDYAVHWRGGERGEHMYNVFPPHYSWIALPFYVLFGLHGLNILSIICFLAVNYIIFQIIRTVSGKYTLAVLGIAAYTFATFSQDFANVTWPHALSTFLVYLIPYLAYTRTEYTKKFLFFSGFIAFAAVGVRISNIIFLPLYFLYFLFTVKNKRDSIYFVLGGIVPLTYQLWTNEIRFGNWLNLMGSTKGSLNPVDGSAGLFAALKRFINVVFNSSYFPDRRIEWEFGITKALLQASPFLVLAAFVRQSHTILQKKPYYRFLMLFGGVAVMNLLFYGLSRTFSFAQVYPRYLHESLPGLTIMALLVFGMGMKDRVQKRGLLVLALTAVLLVASMSTYYKQYELPFAQAGHWIALTLLILAAGYEVTRRQRIVGTVFVSVAILAFMFSVFVSTYDNITVNVAQRRHSATLIAGIRPAVGDNSVVVTYGPNAWRMTQLKAFRDVFIGRADKLSYDYFMHLPRDIERIIGRLGRKVYIHTTTEHPVWDTFVTEHLLPLFDHRLILKTKDQALYQIDKSALDIPWDAVEAGTYDIGSTGDALYIYGGFSAPYIDQGGKTFRIAGNGAEMHFFKPKADQLVIETLGRQEHAKEVTLLLNGAELFRFEEGVEPRTVTVSLAGANFEARNTLTFMTGKDGIALDTVRFVKSQ